MKKLIWIVFILVTLEVIAEVPTKVQQAADNQSVRPKLVVVIVADQFRYDYLLRFASEYREGMKQLVTRGAVFTNAHYEHFPTLTAVGHAALLSGAFPSVTGIIGNSWYDRYKSRIVQAASDSAVQLVGAAGGPGSSPRNLLVSTVGDELKIAGQGRNRVLGLSLKDYSGILASGHMADAVYWLDGRSGNFVSSTYYIKELPAWVQAFNAGRPADQYKGREWQGTKLSSETGPKLYGMLQFTPFGNELLEKMAEAAIKAEQLGRDADTDLLVLSFSSNDYIGHSHGPDSVQVRDVCLATDLLLGKLFKFIDAQVGMSNVAVVFAADHGVAPMPEVNAERKMPGGRVAAATVLTAVKNALVEKYGDGNWIAAAPEEAIYLDWNLIRAKKLTEQEVAAEAAKAIQALPHVFRVYTREQITKGVPAGDRVGRRIVNSYSFGRGPDLCVLLDPYYFFGAGRSTTHGTPFGYDSHVPVIFMGPGIKAGRFDGTIAVNDIAPTLATMLGIETPSGSEGRVLSEIFGMK
jgi:predicted AlkP superfamily pyrophosphatase or phosphodiesterase